MRRAYAVLGVLFLVVGAGGWWALDHSSRSFPQTSSKVTSTIPQIATSSMEITSSAFENNGSVPALYTCDGTQISPPLAISGVPPEAKSLALIMEDPDVPRALLSSGLYVHWILFNIPTSTAQIAEGESAGVSGSNSSGSAGYVGPCPPTQYEPSEHRYIFTLYALDSELPLMGGAGKEALEVAMQGHVLEEVQLVGRYKRSDTSKQ